MIGRESFISVLDAIDAYFNGEIFEAFNTLGIAENKINDHIDAIIVAIDNDVDPKHLARQDENVLDCGSYIFEWLFGTSDFQEKCKTAGQLYDYIVAQYLEKIDA